jgi:hypothetical protein
MSNEEQNGFFAKPVLAEVALHEVEIMERFYDFETDDFGNKKPNKPLGKFLMSDEWEKKLFENYSCNTYGIKDNELYEIIGKEVSGFYHRGQGGIRFSVVKLSENETIKTWEWFRSHFC